jgi:hypothetical protein
MRRIRKLLIVLLTLALPLQGTSLAAQACVCPADAAAAMQVGMVNCDAQPSAQHSTHQQHAPDCTVAGCVCTGATPAVSVLPAALRTWTLEALEPAVQIDARPFSFDPCPGPWRPPRAC